MKNLTLSFLLLLLSSVSVFAQTSSKKSSIFIDLGASFPTGDFNAKNVADEKAGLATTGFFIDLGYQYQFSKSIGAIAMFGWKTNGIDKNSLNYSLPTGSGGSMSINAEAWQMANVLAGLTQSISLTKNEKFFLEFRELAGVQFSSSPEINFNYSIPGIGSGSNKQEKSNASSFIFLLGTGFKYMLSDKIGLKLSADYMSSNPKFMVITYPADAPVEHQSEQKISSLNIGAGLVLSF